jgi:hypothetical protein
MRFRSTIVRRASLAAAVAVALPAFAQAPVVTPKGDPSVNADTIYRLAVRPADYPEETSILLLDDGIVRYEPDGRGSTTFRSITQVLRPDASEGLSERRFSYAPKHEKFTLNWIRVVKPDGTVISEKPSHLQESDVPAEMGDPTYSDRKVIRASLTGVEPGVLIDVSYTTEELKPFLAGDFFESWSIHAGGTVRRSRYILDVPEGFTPRIREINLTFRRTEKVSGGRHVYTWAVNDVKRVKAEVFAPDSNGVLMSLRVSSPINWTDIGKWYADNAKSRYVLTPAVEAKLSSVVEKARTLGDSVAAVHRWIAQDIRYVSIALGLGGYQPRSPDEVVKTGFGDCKDKATIFVTAIERMGLEARPVILNSEGGVKRDQPSMSQFDHVIAAYRKPGATTWSYTDLTSALTPLGELPFPEQGAFGLLVSRDGATEEITFPKAPRTANRTVRRIRGMLSPDGEFNGEVEEVGTGYYQYQLRSLFEHPLDTVQRKQILRIAAGTVFENADGDSLEAFDGRNLSATARVWANVKGAKAATSAGNSMLLNNPLKPMSSFTAAAKELDDLPERLFPIDPEAIFGYGASEVEVVITLPDGWHAQLPSPVIVESPFGNYRTEYTQTGRELRMSRIVAGGTGGIQSPSRIKALTAWMRDIGKDDTRIILIDKNPVRP